MRNQDFETEKQISQIQAVLSKTLTRNTWMRPKSKRLKQNETGSATGMTIWIWKEIYFNGVRFPNP
jgi:hypothetical protein